MTVHFKLPEQNAIAARAGRLIEAGADREIVLGVMRQGGLGKMDSIKLLSELIGVGLVESKNLVHYSRAWRDAFSRDTEFKASLEEALRALDEDAIS